MGTRQRNNLILLGLGVAYAVALIAGSRLGNQVVALATALGVGLAAFAMWAVVSTYAGGDEPHHSRLSMFRSQWQVPLYAALMVYLTVVLGTYLKSLGAEGSCGAWPLCGPAVFAYPLPVVIANLAHRLAAGLSGLFLLYTTAFVWRRHQNRPVLLVLTAISVVFFTVQALLGAQAATMALSPLGSMAHVAVATALTGTLVALAAVGYYAPSLPVIAGGSEAAALPAVAVMDWKATAKAYFATTKPGVLVLLLVTAYFGMWVAAKGMPPLGLTLVTMLGLGMSCGAANAINMWYDQDIDAIMKRTQGRPIPAGKLTPGQVLAFGVMTGALSFVLLAAAVNLMTAVLAMAGLLFYVGIYTMWLKRSSIQNIVIGGAAGAVPPLVGWAAVTGQMSWAAWIMFAIIFVWTPPHFWALALFKNDDYRSANVPMMPVVKGEMYTKRQIVAYALLLIPTAMSLYWTGVVGTFYLWSSLALSVVYFASTVLLYRERLPVQKWAVKSFKWSQYYLALIFLVMAVSLIK